MFEKTNFEERARAALDDLQNAAGVVVEDAQNNRDMLDEAIYQLRAMPGWLRADLQQAMRERAIQVPASDPMTEVIYATRREALRQLSEEDRNQALADSIADCDLGTIRSVLGAPAWASGLSSTHHDQFRGQAYDALIQHVVEDHDAAQNVLANIENVIAQVETTLRDSETLGAHRQAMAAFHQKLGLVGA